MVKHLRYLVYMMKHKWPVFVECYKLGIIWRGLTHDMSKFLPDEWLPYASRFAAKKVHLTPSDDFKIAWMLHIKRNGHHWQHWLVDKAGNRVFEMLTEQQVKSLKKEVDSGYTKELCEKVFGEVYPLPMPDKYRKEMLADWKGAGKALRGLSAREYYRKLKGNMILHPETREWIENNL